MNRTLSLLAFLCAGSAMSQSPLTIALEQMSSGLTRITDITHAGDERLFVVLQAGSIRVVQPDGSVLPTPFLNITSIVNDASNEQGLLGLAFDPAYADNGRFYVCYTAGSGNGTSRVSRFNVSSTDPNIADATSEEILYTWPQPYSNHNGGDLDFGPDGYLYVGFGDGGSGGDPQNNAQDLTDPLGDIIRIDVSGETGWTAPADNPHIGNSAALPEIWASGLRNPWRFGFDRLTGDIWIGDVGQNAVEEMDFWPAGDNTGPNFGWRCYEGNSAYNTAGCLPQGSYVAPIAVHQQSQQGWCSIIGGRVYRGELYPRLEGRHIYTDYCGGQFYSLRQNDLGTWVREQLLASGQYGYVCIGENAAGELFAGNSQTGTLHRIKDACPMPMPVLTSAENTLTSTAGGGYAWYLNGVLLPEANGQTLEATASGTYYVIVDQGTNCELQSNSLYVSLVGVNEAAASPIRVFPVPADDLLRMEGLSTSATVLEISDLAGRVVVSRSINDGQGALQVSVAHLVPGNYAYLVRHADGVTEQRGVVTIAR